MSTAPLENATTPGGARFTKIYDLYGNHIITRDAHTELEWLAGFVGIWTNQDSCYGDAANVCRQLTVGGYDDWHVPTLKEALSANGADEFWYWGDSGTWIWTCTPDIDERRGEAWVVKFGKDHAFKAPRTTPHCVRPVRGQMRTDITATPKAGES
ncbi:DUF1566 domain-containing protein [Xylella fastidiosa]|uniref:Lcl domain-containing protein n=1 Tax=Xylella fastidiosa TaxID=2371 RepID=UPI00249E98AE|nr:DUF1566 domain-containing protein [Xylella fastidiosa]WGZ33580.1 DUF1566 domain-containing protein [Xylella fastidiosa subsp. pauca]